MIGAYGARVPRGKQRLLRLAAVAMLLTAVSVSLGCREAPSEPTAAPVTTPTPVAEPTPALEPTPEAPATGLETTVPIMASVRHIERGEAHEPYSTDPPTSGPHYSQPATAGFYTDAPPDEEIVHSLEHGYVVIWYRADDLRPAERDKLTADVKAAMKAAGDSELTLSPKLIAVPRPSLKERIALTSWGHLARSDRFDRERVLEFIERYRDGAPEQYAR